MALTRTFIRNAKHSDKPASDKRTDGIDMDLLVKASGKDWRVDDRTAAERKTLALGIYSEVSVAVACKRCVSAGDLRVGHSHKLNHQNRLWRIIAALQHFLKESHENQSIVRIRPKNHPGQR